jgi:hypothetical protein
MKQLVYLHRSVKPLLVVLFSWVHGWVTHWLGCLVSRLSLTRRRLIILRWVAVLVSLAIQGVMLYLLSELVELCILLMEVWAELAAKHLEITLDKT